MMRFRCVALPPGLPLGGPSFLWIGRGDSGTTVYMSLLRLQKLDTSQKEWAILLSDIAGKCVAAGNVNHIFVFGSFARGEMSQASDLDIAIILRDGVQRREYRRSLPSPLASWPLDLIIVNQSRFDATKAVGGICLEIHQDGIELFPIWKWGMQP